MRLRRDGYRKALAAAGLQAQRRLLPARRAGPKPGDARRRQARSRRRGAPPDALFCGNDQIARGAADALRERGIAVPDDVAVVGFDNWDVMAEATRPPLTSVDMNLEALGREAGALLMEMIGGRRAERRAPPALHARHPRFVRGARPAPPEQGRQS